VTSPLRSTGGVENIYMPPGSKVMYLGGASGTTVSHVSDVVRCGAGAQRVVSRRSAGCPCAGRRLQSNARAYT
jgi:hypothetical protein